MVSSITVANEFISLAKKDGYYFTPMQLLKLVYIAHGWMFGFFNEPLIDDDIEAFPTWLEGIWESFQNAEVVLVGGNDFPKYEITCNNY